MIIVSRTFVGNTNVSKNELPPFPHSLTHSLTHLKEQCTSEANRLSASQEIHRILLNSKFQYLPSSVLNVKAASFSETSVTSQRRIL